METEVCPTCNDYGIMPTVVQPPLYVGVPCPRCNREADR